MPYEYFILDLSDPLHGCPSWACNTSIACGWEDDTEASPEAGDGEDDDAAWHALVASSLRRRGVDVGAPDGHDDPRRESSPPTLAARAFDVMVATHLSLIHS